VVFRFFRRLFRPKAPKLLARGKKPSETTVLDKRQRTVENYLRAMKAGEYTENGAVQNMIYHLFPSLPKAIVPNIAREFLKQQKQGIKEIRPEELTRLLGEFTKPIRKEYKE